MSIKEGLEIEGQAPAPPDVNSDAGFSAAVAAQAQAGKPTETSEEPVAPVDPSRQSAEQIVASLVDPQTSPSLADGMTVAEPRPAEYPLGPAQEERIDAAARRARTHRGTPCRSLEQHLCTAEPVSFEAHNRC
jgi:hypothetical protein